jgi:hypothetical protein
VRVIQKKNKKKQTKKDLLKDAPNPTIVRITPYLSLGSETDAAGDLKSMGITHLLNVSISSPNIPITGLGVIMDMSSYIALQESQEASR